MSDIIVADAGPLHYLILIDCAVFLPRLFGRVLIPPTVRDELLHPSTPRKVREWIIHSPAWLRMEPVGPFVPVARLHPGEGAALHLAIQTKTPAVLMDDLDGRSVARRLGLTVVGTIGVLERMAEIALISLPAIVNKLQQTNFFVSPELLQAALERDRERHAT